MYEHGCDLIIKFEMHTGWGDVNDKIIDYFKDKGYKLANSGALMYAINLREINFRLLDLISQKSLDEFQSDLIVLTGEKSIEVDQCRWIMLPTGEEDVTAYDESGSPIAQFEFSKRKEILANPA